MAESLPPKKTEVEIPQFLKREEVRTMAKDIARLRAKDAAKERERIVSLGETSQSNKKTGFQPAPPPLMPHEEKRALVYAKTKTRFEKILIRFVVAGILIFLLFNGIALGYWYFIVKKAPALSPPQEPIAQPQPPSPSLSLSPSPVFFFNTISEKTLELQETQDLLLLLSNVLQEEHEQGFTRILLKKHGENAFLNTREFLARTSLAAPEPLLALVKEDFMLFLYSSPGRKRLGFIGEFAQTEGVQDMLKSWETTLEQDTKPLWEIVGQKGSAYTPFFRQAVHQNNVVRFQTFSVVDFGVVYTLFGAKLILTTSFESMAKAVDLLMQSR